MKNEWFNVHQGVDGRFQVDEAAAYNAGTCNAGIHYYNNCSLHRKDTTYWSRNFKDLLRLCNLRSRRNHLGKLFNNNELSTKCSNLNFVGEDGKCNFNDESGNEQWRHCNTWDAPNCNTSSGMCDNSSDPSQIAAEYSMPTAWNHDADLEYCFPAREADLDAPSEEFTTQCRNRFLLSNRNWPQEEWTKKKPNLFWETSKVQDWYQIIENQEYDDPLRNWNVHTIPEVGDLYMREFECTTSDRCWTDANNGDNHFRSTAEFNAQGCTKVNVEGMTFEAAPTLDEYTASLEECRGDDSDKVFDENDYDEFYWPEHTDEQLQAIPNP